MPTKTKEQLEAEYDAMYADTDDEEEQADVVKEEAVLMRKVRRGWSQFGVDDPWFVVHSREAPMSPSISFGAYIALN